MAKEDFFDISVLDEFESKHNKLNGSKNRIFGAIGILMLLLVVAAIAVLFTNGKPQKPEPSVPGYYTGPMKSKGNSNLYTPPGPAP